MPPRYQKYRLKWPLTPNQLINIDEMFSEIFTDLAHLSVSGGLGLGSYTIGDILTAISSTTLGVVAPGAAGYVLTSNGIGVVPSYQVSTGGGYWAPLTNGDVTTPELIFAGGDVIMCHIL
jgi:hypothetical protein